MDRRGGTCYRLYPEKEEKQEKYPMEKTRKTSRGKNRREKEIKKALPQLRLKNNNVMKETWIWGWRILSGGLFFEERG